MFVLEKQFVYNFWGDFTGDNPVQWFTIQSAQVMKQRNVSAILAKPVPQHRPCATHHDTFNTCLNLTYPVYPVKLVK